MAGLFVAIQAVVVAVLASVFGFGDVEPTKSEPTESRVLLKISLEQPVRVTDPCSTAKAA